MPTKINKNPETAKHFEIFFLKKEPSIEKLVPLAEE
jgi:hypothetical protein